MVNTTKHVEPAEDMSAIVPIPAKRCRRGEPSGELCQLNLDVLHLIAEYIHPRDLLTLARTCRSLRELLMDKSSKFVWKAARGQVPGLPDCPADLTEPEYANLAFHPRCHGCGKYAKMILWHIRRRYCPKCRTKRLRKYSSCDAIVRQYNVLATEDVTVKRSKGPWVDQEQLGLFLQEYHHSSDREQFLAERSKKLSVISHHASYCKRWANTVELDRMSELSSLRRKREDDIFERLKQHGYGPEIAYHGRYSVYIRHKSLFESTKPLTDREWAWMLPEWIKTMESLTAQRIERDVYEPRRESLASALADYVKDPPPNTPVLDLLPNLKGLMEFSPFRDIIYAPERTDFGPWPFASAFEKLPGLVDDWRKRLDIKLAELVKIPSDAQSKANMTSTRLSIQKLHLACAVFKVNYAISRYPDVFSRGYPEEVSFWEAAAHIVKVCGLDPNVATVEDMDQRNARLKCLMCRDRCLRTWRNAIQHAHSSYQSSKHWKIVDDGWIDAIQAIEQEDDRAQPLQFTRCLLCRPRVGDSMSEYDMKSHFVVCHGIDPVNIQRDVHFTSVCMQVGYCSVRMAKDGTLEEFRSNVDEFTGP